MLIPPFFYQILVFGHERCRLLVGDRRQRGASGGAGTAAREHRLLVGRHDHDAHLGRVARDRRRVLARVALLVERDAEELEAATDALTHLAAVLADARREHQQVESAKHFGRRLAATNDERRNVKTGSLSLGHVSRKLYLPAA